MEKKIEPTITLANLYEVQKQYIDALQIYKKIANQKPSNELENKIDKLNQKVFSEKNKYHKLINNLFSTEDKMKFGILTSKQYQDFQKSHKKIEELETYPEEMLDVKLSEKNNPKESKAQSDIEKLLIKLQEIDSQKLREILSENFGENYKLNDLKLSELNSAIKLVKNDENKS